ncbi:hypothetical protein ACFWPK_22565 [Nocardia sp. NPDC058519]|uniref:hypothetical protein n=1 Tax=Nocardia sp. NPDC058519 TaxID=3346535 RepID=UPI0036619190
MTTTEPPLTPARLAVAAEGLCPPGIITKGREWSDESAELELRSGYAITITREQGSLRWSVVTHNADLPQPGELAVVIDEELPADRDAAAAKVAEMCEKWADAMGDARSFDRYTMPIIEGVDPSEVGPDVCDVLAEQMALNALGETSLRVYYPPTSMGDAR